MKKPHPTAGNKFYLLRSKDGRDRIYKTPDELWVKCCEYFTWVEANPLKEQRVFSTKTGIIKTNVSKTRAMTLAGLNIRLGISKDTFSNYRKRPEFKWVVEAVDDIMYSQKFEGAAAGMLNACIIARDLGLKDKSEVHNTNINSDMKDPIIEMKKRGIPVPEIDIEDIE